MSAERWSPMSSSGSVARAFRPVMFCGNPRAGKPVPPRKPHGFRYKLFGWLTNLLASTVLLSARTREVYVWQPHFSTEVAATLRTLQPEFDGCCVLAAEVTWTGGRKRGVRPQINHG